MGWSNIERNAPYTVDRPWPLSDENNTGALINIRVRQLQGEELGLLNGAVHRGPAIDSAITNAFAAKNSDDLNAYKKTTAQLTEMSASQGYLNSPAHTAWSEAAEARSGGKMSAENWRKMDPFGGTAGNGPNILAGGSYPGPVSVISMGHDTDWSLGRYFNAGPMKALHTTDANPTMTGLYGLNHLSTVRPLVRDLYTGGGHADWEVDYGKNRQDLDQKLQERERRLLYGANPEQGNSAVASAKTNGLEGTHLEKHATQLNKAVDGTGIPADKKEDAVAAVLKNTVDAKFDPKADVNLAQSTKDPNVFIASQGQSPGILRADPVDVSKVQPGSAQTVTAELLRNTNTQQQVASNTVEPVEQNPTRGGRGIA
jgi:hypothetical protein